MDDTSNTKTSDALATLVQDARHELLKRAHVQAEDRYVGLCEAADNFLQTMGEKYGITPKVNPSVMYDVCVSTYHDIWRYKFFHQDDPLNDWSNAVKRAAYFTKWIMKLRPIFVDGSTALADSKVHLANEFFAIHWSLALLRDETQKQILLTKEKFGEFTYLLHFRDLSTDGLIQNYQLLKDFALSTDTVFEKTS